MNIEDYREYCLSLGADVEEKLPFQKFFAKQSGKAERQPDFKKRLYSLVELTTPQIFMEKTKNKSL